MPNPELSFTNGLLSGLKSYYPSTGVEFVAKVNDILDALEFIFLGGTDVVSQQEREIKPNFPRHNHPALHYTTRSL